MLLVSAKRHLDAYNSFCCDRECLYFVAELYILAILCAAVLVGCDSVLNGSPYMDLRLSV